MLFFVLIIRQSFASLHTETPISDTNENYTNTTNMQKYKTHFCYYSFHLSIYFTLFERFKRYKLYFKVEHQNQHEGKFSYKNQTKIYLLMLFFILIIRQSVASLASDTSLNDQEHHKLTDAEDMQK